MLILTHSSEVDTKHEDRLLEPATSIRFKLNCAYSKDSNQSVYLHCLTRALIFSLKKRLDPWIPIEYPLKSLIRMCGCDADWRTCQHIFPRHWLFWTTCIGIALWHYDWKSEYDQEIPLWSIIHTSMTILYINAVKSVLSDHSKIDKTKILMTNGGLMKVENIAECSLWSIL